jgi:hypothetical protein
VTLTTDTPSARLPRHRAEPTRPEDQPAEVPSPVSASTSPSAATVHMLYTPDRIPGLGRILQGIHRPSPIPNQPGSQRVPTPRSDT